jgi:hypothetical protein
MSEIEKNQITRLEFEKRKNVKETAEKYLGSQFEKLGAIAEGIATVLSKKLIFSDDGLIDIQNSMQEVRDCIMHASEIQRRTKNHFLSDSVFIPSDFPFEDMDKLFQCLENILNIFNETAGLAAVEERLGLAKSQNPQGDLSNSPRRYPAYAYVGGALLLAGTAATTIIYQFRHELKGFFGEPQTLGQTVIPAEILNETTKQLMDVPNLSPSTAVPSTPINANSASPILPDHPPKTNGRRTGRLRQLKVKGDVNNPWQ